jgi:hypothetical protein
MKIACTDLSLKTGTIGYLQTSVTINQRGVAFQKSEDLIYTAAEA